MTDAELAARCNRTADGSTIKAHQRRARIAWILFAAATTATALSAFMSALEPR